MKQQLTVHATNAPAMLERLLRVVRHRGFAVQQLGFDVVDERHVHIQLTLDSDKPISLLQNQLLKLIDVMGVELTASATQPALSTITA